MTELSFSPDTPSIPGSYVINIVSFLEEHHGDLEQAFQVAKIDRDLFQPERDFVSEEQFHDLLKNVIEQTSMEDVGLQIGTRMTMFNHGQLSTALLTANSINDAFNLWRKFYMLAIHLLRPSIHLNGKKSFIEIECTSRYPLVNKILIEAAIATMHRAGSSFVLAEPISPTSFDLIHPQPKYISAYNELVNFDLKFSQSANRFYFDEAGFREPMPTADATAHRFSVSSCEKNLEDFLNRYSYAAQVRTYLASNIERNVKASEIAEHLNVSERTLKRFLLNENTSYRVLTQSVKHEYALRYLQDHTLNVEEVALKLGYQETSSFRAAFKVWENMSPREWRKAHALESNND